MATAQDLMTKDPVLLEAASSIKDAVEIFTKRKFTSAPVVNSAGDVIGFLTEMSLVRAIVLHQLQPEKYQKLGQCAVLFEDAAFVSVDDSVSMVIRALLNSITRRVLVKGNGRKIIGIISPKDLLKVIQSESEISQVVQNEIANFSVK